jgi:hypothetical protein
MEATLQEVLDWAADMESIRTTHIIESTDPPESALLIETPFVTSFLFGNASMSIRSSGAIIVSSLSHSSN